MKKTGFPWAASLAALLIAACSHGVSTQVVQVRELIGFLPPIPGERTFFAYAELHAVHGSPPRLSVFLLAPDGTRQAVVHALTSEAEEAAAVLASGEALPGTLSPYLGVGLDPGPPLPLRPTSLGPPLEGVKLRIEKVRDPQYGVPWVVSLEAEGTTVELHRFFLPDEGDVRFLALTPDAAAAAVSSESEAGRVSDVIAIDLLAGGSRLFVSQAMSLMDLGDLDGAGARLLRASVLGAPEDGELWYAKARHRALVGETPDRIVDALGRAIREEPHLYRMRARTEPDFLGLQRAPAFRELVRPRALPGSNRAGRGADVDE